MIKPSTEFLKRAKKLNLMPLVTQHHYIIDQIYEDFENGFTSDDVYQAMTENVYILEDKDIAGRTGLIKVLVVTSIDGLLSAEMISESTTLENSYDFRWEPCKY